MFADERQRNGGGAVPVVRQPVLDRRLRPVGYRIAYAPAADEPGTEAADLYADIVGATGFPDLVGDAVAHLPVSRDLLLAAGVPSVRPDRIVLRIGYDDAGSADVAAILENSVAHGYALELDGIPGAELDDRLLDLFGMVEVDFSRCPPEEIAALMPRINDHCGTAVASSVRTHEQRALAEQLGFQWFVGPFLATPNTLAGIPVPVSDLSALLAVARLQGDSASLEELIEVIRCDSGLSVRLLRFINSAHFSFPQRIGTIRQAAMLLGPRELARWTLLVAALDAAPKAPAELTVMALTRARLCERLAARRPDTDPDELFTVGLLSLLDALLGIPLEAIVRELPLTQSIAGALLGHDGAAGGILAAVIAYEHGEFSARALADDLPAAGAAYRDSLGWATRAVAA